MQLLYSNSNSRLKVSDFFDYTNASLCFGSVEIVDSSFGMPFNYYVEAVRDPIDYISHFEVYISLFDFALNYKYLY